MIPGDPRPHQQVLKAACTAEYETAHADIYHRLIHINTSIEILETVVSFPLKHLRAPDDPFFDTLYWNFTYACVVMLHALLADGPSDFGIPDFKKRLMRDWLPDHETQALQGRLRRAKFSQKANTLKSRMATMRHKVVAHRNPEAAMRSLSIPGLTIGDLRMLYNETEALFAACCFAIDYGTTLYPPGTVGGRPVEKDIEQFMRLLLADSEWLRQPERDGQWWPEMRRLMPRADLDELNHGRVRLGLPEA